MIVESHNKLIVNYLPRSPGEQCNAKEKKKFIALSIQRGEEGGGRMRKRRRIVQGEDSIEQIFLASLPRATKERRKTFFFFTTFVIYHMRASLEFV